MSIIEPTINASELFRKSKSRQPSEADSSKLSRSHSRKRLGFLPARREFRNRLAAVEEKTKIKMQKECLNDLKRLGGQAQELKTLEAKLD